MKQCSERNSCILHQQLLCSPQNWLMATFDCTIGQNLIIFHYFVNWRAFHSFSSEHEMQSECEETPWPVSLQTPLQVLDPGMAGDSFAIQFFTCQKCINLKLFLQEHFYVNKFLL